MAGEKKIPIRWDWIEERWREYTLSNRQIAAEHERVFGRKLSETAIRHYVSENGLQREHDNALRREVRTQLAAQIVRKEFASPDTDDSQTPVSSHELRRAQIEREEAPKIKAEADSLVLIARRQIDDLAESRDLAKRAAAHLRVALQLDADGEPLESMLPGDLKDLVSAANGTAYALIRCINTERRIFGMDDKDGNPTNNSDGNSSIHTSGVRVEVVYYDDNTSTSTGDADSREADSDEADD